jgi:glycosyltransferase involved in cell wall biosynthesis
LPHIARRKAIPEQQELPIAPVKFSLIIPSYNNASELMRELPGLIGYFNTQGFDAEIIIVNDGSAEVKALRNYCVQNGFKLIDHDINQGKGASVRTGMMQASRDIRIFTDADIPFQYHIFDDIIARFKQPEVKIVCGDRRKSDYFRKYTIGETDGQRRFFDDGQCDHATKHGRYTMRHQSISFAMLIHQVLIANRISKDLLRTLNGFIEPVNQA